MAHTPPANTDSATRKSDEHSQALMKADIGRTESRIQTYVWKVFAGTGIALHLALAATMLAGFQFLS